MVLTFGFELLFRQHYSFSIFHFRLLLFLIFPNNMLKILFLTVLAATVSSKSLRIEPTTTTHTEDINEAKATVVTSDHVKTMNVSFF